MAKKKTEPTEVCRSMAEFDKKYFPKSYEEELERQRIKNSGPAGTGLVSELLEGIRRGLAAQKKRRKHPA